MKLIKVKAFIYFVTVSAIFLLYTGHLFAADQPTNDHLKRTMECDWAILNQTEPVDPNDYVNDPDDDLVKLAESLDYDPVKIYSWVYNNVYYPQYFYEKGGYNYVYYKYSRLGARGAYLNKLGNAWDQSSLLICLLRISGIPARYVQLGTTDLVYVEAYIEQDNYHGDTSSAQKDWLPMVPWLKEIDLTSALELFPTDGTIADTVPAGLEYDFTDYLSNVKYKSALEEYEEKLQHYLDNNHPGKSLKNIPFKENIIDRTGSILPRSFPESLKNFISYGKTKFFEVPEDQRHNISLSIRKRIDQYNSEDLLEHTIYMPEVAGKRFALDWDYSAGSSFIPVFKIDGKIVETDVPGTALAFSDNFYIQYNIYGRTDTVTRPERIAGTYIQMGFDPFSASIKTIEKAKQKLHAISAADAQKVLTPATHEEYLGLMGQVLVETFLNRMHENSKKGAGYFHGTLQWNLCPTFIYTNYNSTETPIPTDTESKFYYHPQWNIDAQSIAVFFKWDHAQGRDQIIVLDWDAPIYQTCRWLSGYAASYDEGRIFEDWMDTPGASTIKGLMLANEDIHGTGNYMVELTQTDIVNETQAGIADFNTITVHDDSGDDWVSYYDAYDGFQFLNIKRVPDNWVYTYNGNQWPLDGSAIDGAYGLMIWTDNPTNHDYSIIRGTKFDLGSMKLSSIVDGVQYQFTGYRKNSSNGFSYVSGCTKNVTVNKAPNTVTFDWTDINKIKIARISSTNGPIVIDNLQYIRKEYVSHLDDQTTLHLGYSTVMQIMNALYEDGRVITPVQQVRYEGLEGNVRIVHSPGKDLYAFGMDHGGAASPHVTYNTNPAPASTYTPAPAVSPASYDNILSDYTIDIESSGSNGIVPQYYNSTIEWANKAIYAAGDPVDMATGEFYTEEKPDLMIKSRGFNLSVTRKYKSRLVYNGPFGFGWSWNHSERILPLNNGGINYYDNEGTVFEITLENDVYLYPPGTRFILEKITEGELSGGYIVTRNESREKTCFNPDGNLKKRTDRFGNTIDYEYTDPSHPHRITIIKDELNRSLTLAYNTNGKVISVTDFTGRACYYFYSDDEQGNPGPGDDLIEFRGLDYEAGLNNSTKFEYLSDQANGFCNHNMIKYTMAGGDFLEIGYFKNDQTSYHKNAKGEIFHFHYSRLNQYSETWNEEGYYRKIFFNKFGDVVRCANEDGTIEQMVYDEYGPENGRYTHHNKIAHTDGNGNTTTFRYYPDGTPETDQEAFAKQRKVYKKTNALGHTRQYLYDDPNNPCSPSKIQDPAGNITEFVYYSDGSLHKKIQAPGFKLNINGELIEGEPGDGFETTYEYDSCGNITKITDPAGNYETSDYDIDLLFLESKTDKNGNQTRYTYYEQDNPESMPAENLKSVTVSVGENEYSTFFEYNNSNRKTKETDPLNQITQYQYDINGKLKTTILPNGAVTEHIYDTARDIVSGAQIIRTIDPLFLSEHYTYNATGKLVSKQDRNQNKTTYEYDPMGRLATETDPFQNSIVYEYDGNGNIAGKTGKQGAVSTFIYDAANRLKEENLPCGKNDSDSSIIRKTYEYYPDNKIKLETIHISDPDHEDITLFYEYNALGHLVQKTSGYNSSHPLTTLYRYDAQSRLTKIIQPLGNYQETEYDGNGNKIVVSFFDRNDNLLEETEYQYNEQNLVTQITDPSGNITTIAYDALGQKKSQTQISANDLIETFREYDPVGSLIKQTDPLGRITQYFYDLNNQKTKIIDASGETTVFDYDPNGNRISITFPDHSEKRLFYDALNRKIGEQDELGYLQFFDYDASSNLIAHTDAGGFTTTFDYDAANRIFKRTNALDHTREIEYDEANRKLKSTDAKGIVTEYQYDSHNNPIKETVASGTQDPAVTRYLYDDNNRKIEEINELKISETEIRSLKTAYAYDDRGLFISLTEGSHTADPEVYNYEYNAKKELVKITDPKGNVTEIFYDTIGRKVAQTRADGLIEHYLEYDNADNIVLERMPEGEEILKSYDNLDRLHLLIKGEDQKRFEYDGRGRLIREINFNNDITNYKYDKAGRMVEQTAAAGTPDEATTSFSYDENGNILTITNPVNKSISYDYNELNQRVKETDADGTFKTITYNPNGHIESIIRQDNTLVEYTYDDFNRKSEVKFGGRLQQKFEYDTLSGLTLAEDYNNGSATHSTTFSYNDFHRLETETQGLYAVGSLYDKNGNKTEIAYPSGKTVQKSYDNSNNLSAIYNETELAAQFTHDRNNRLVFASFANNTNLSLDYDYRGREIYRSYATPALPLFSTDKSYDPQSNILTGTTLLNNINQEEEFTYDHLDRLTALSEDSAPSAVWQYDKVGNWEATDQNGSAETRTVNNDNEYTLVNNVATIFDDRGNMTSDGGLTYIYDWNNRLVEIKSGAQSLVEYTYDALNRRVAKQTESVNTTFVYDGESVIEEYTNGGLEHLFIYTDYIDDPILTEINGQDYYYIKDSQFSIKAIIDANGDLIETYKYNPFGLISIQNSQGVDITTSGSTISNPYGYTGRRWDTESGLWYYRNRIYSASLGRFMQRDPSGYTDGLNLYTYVLNNPLRYTDPDGLMARSAYDATTDFYYNHSNTINSSLQIAGGVVEASAGYTLGTVLSPTIAGGIAGAAIGTHGVDQLWSGIQSLRQGEKVDPFTSQIMQSAGISRETANLTNDIISVATTTAVGVINVRSMSNVVSTAPKSVVDPKNIRFTQNSIGRTFKDKRTLQSLVDDLKAGKISADDVPAISVFEKNGKTFSLDNRRLKAFQEAGVPIRTVNATPQEIANEAWKFTTKTDGLTIKVRGGGL